MNKVSVIVAAYNVEDYIEYALQSLVNQTLQECEFIVVNDASTDGTLEIINRYKTKDKRIKIINCENNRGLLSVRKTGILNSDGEYVMFLDGDDFLENNACEKAYNAIRSENVDVLQFETNIVKGDNVSEDLSAEISHMYTYLKSLDKKIISNGQDGLLSNLEIVEDLNFNVWNKIYSKQILSKVALNLPDEHIVMAEDLLFSYLMCFFAKSYSCCDEILYNYRFGNGASTTTKISKLRNDYIIKTGFVYKFLEEWANKHLSTPACEKRLQDIKLQITLSIGNTFLNQINDSERNDFLCKIRQWFTIEEVLSVLFYLTQYDKMIDYGKLSKCCSELETFKTKPRKVRTVATFYRRMYNGGVENVVAKLANLWVENGYNVIIFSNEAPNEDDYYINPNVKRVVLPVTEWRDIDSFGNRCRILRENLEKYSVDVMIYHSWNDYGLVLDGLLTKSLGIPFVVHTHNVFCIDAASEDWWCAYESLEMHNVYSFCDLVIGLSKSDCAYWSAMGLNCIHTVNPNGISLETKQSELKGNTVVMVCRIFKEKQIEDGIKIIKKVIEKIPDAKLVIVGDGDNKEYVSEIDALIKEYALKDTVVRVGFQNDVIPYYQKSDVFLMTSKYEGAPLAVMESKICGLPLVSYDMPNLDTLKNPEGTFVVPQGDVDRAAEKIIHILSNDELKRRMGAEARASAQKILSVNLAQHWENIFKKLSMQAYNEEMVFSADDVCMALKTIVYYTKQGYLVRLKSIPENCSISDLGNVVTWLGNENKRLLDEYDKLSLFSQTTTKENKRLLDEYDKLNSYINTLNSHINTLNSYLKTQTEENKRLLDAYDKADSYIKEREAIHQSIQNDLEKMIEEIKLSKSYRLGLFLTKMPRKIKEYINRRKRNQ